VGPDLKIGGEALQFGGRPHPDFGSQMSQLEFQLATGYVEATLVTNGPDSRSVESVAAHFRLHRELCEVVVDCRERGSMRPKSIELRMASVAACLGAEYSSRKQTLAPRCNDSLGVEV
jgi:hypothetical protein